MAETGAPAGSRPGPRVSRRAAYAVELRGITKRFPGVVANRDIELRVRRGEVHAIVGENGAGKSTLMKTLYGMHRPDEGTILLDGREVHFKSPADAIDAGIGMVHQHFMLADNFTVLENIVLGSEPTQGRPARPGRGPPPHPGDLRAVLTSSSTPTSSSRTSASARGSGSRSPRCSTAARRR